MTACNQSEEEASPSSSVPSAEESVTPEPSKLKIGTYNIANGREVNWNFQLIADDIIKNDLDIVGIQEVDQLCNRSKKTDTVAKLKEYTGMQYCVFFKCIDYDGGQYGTAILSKYPIVEYNELELNDGKTVERRLLTYAKIDVEGTYINFFNTHLTVHSAQIRKEEFDTIAAKVNDFENCILVGDFNVGSYNEFKLLEPMSYVNNTTTNYISHPETEGKIDNICYSDDFTLVEDGHGTYQKYHSDHVLLYAEFEYYPAE